MCYFFFLLETEEILIYEEVEIYYLQLNRKRLIVLIGFRNVGRYELRLRLMESDIDRFVVVVFRKFLYLIVDFLNKNEMNKNQDF